MEILLRICVYLIESMNSDPIFSVDFVDLDLEEIFLIFFVFSDNSIFSFDQIDFTEIEALKNLSYSI